MEQNQEISRKPAMLIIFADAVRGYVLPSRVLGGELGEEQSVASQVRFGGIDFAMISLSFISDTLPQLNVLQMPYLYKNSEYMWKILDGEIGRKFLEFFQETGMLGFSWYDAGPRSFYSSRKPIRIREDMEGMVVRVQDSELMCDVITALGAEPYTNAFSEVYSAFETGRIDILL